ncbi:glycosyltransferase [Mariniblastus sp.]|nr:glycosyltransferase [Mariniblastus sp.]
MNQAQTMDSNSPVVLFVYNRSDHLRRTLDALNKNRSIANAKLYIFSDGPRSEVDEKSVNDVRDLIRRKNGFGNTEIVESDCNKGLATSVIEGATQVLEEHGSIVVLEDDVVTSPGWYDFMNGGVNYYKDDATIWSIGGYCPPLKFPASYPHEVFLSPMPTSISWGTWIDRWKLIDWDITDFDEFINDRARINRFCGWKPSRMRLLKRTMRNMNNSWAVRFGYAAAKHEKLNILPIKSKTNHIGYDIGEHMRPSQAKAAVAKYSVELVDEPYEFRDDLHLESQIVSALKKFYHVSTLARVKHFSARLLEQIGIR